MENKTEDYMENQTEDYMENQTEDYMENQTKDYMENQTEDYMENQMGDYMGNHTVSYKKSQMCETRRSGQTHARVLVHYCIMFVLIHGIPFYSIPVHSILHSMFYTQPCVHVYVHIIYFSHKVGLQGIN